VTVWSLRADDHRPVEGTAKGCVLGLVEQRFGLTTCRVEGGVFQSVARVGEWMSGRHGGEQAGAVAVQFDHLMGEAMFTVAPPDHWPLTTELTFDIVVAPPWESETLHVTGRVAGTGTRGGFAHAELTDDSGRLLAIGTTWVHYVPVRRQPQTLDGSGVQPSSALNLAEHLSARMTSDGGAPRVDLLEPGLWTNDFGPLHGGVWASLVELAGSEVFADRGLTTAHVHVGYLRSADLGGPVSVVAQPVHIGRSFGVVGVAGQDALGHRCVTATVTGRRREG
jgi:uncharacterized protein (TIGR00369 family)